MKARTWQCKERREHAPQLTDASEQDRSNPRRLCSAPRPPVAITFLLPWPSVLKKAYQLTFLLIVDNEFLSIGIPNGHSVTPENLITFLFVWKFFSIFFLLHFFTFTPLSGK
jgi:hypothetical protein